MSRSRPVKRRPPSLVRGADAPPKLSWELVDKRMPRPCQGHSAVVVEHKILVVNGTNTDLLMYDTKTNKWSLTGLLVPSRDGNGRLLSRMGVDGPDPPPGSNRKLGPIMFSSGLSSSSSDDSSEDSSEDSDDSSKDPTDSYRSISTSRSAASSMRSRSREESQSPRQSQPISSKTCSFRKGSEQRSKQWSGAALVIDTQFVVVVGGSENPRAVQLYDVASEKSTPLPNMRKGGVGLAAVAVDDEIVVVVGGSNDCAELYRKSTNTRNDIPAMSERRVRCAAAAVGRKVYVFGGRGCRSAEVYDLDSNKWSTLPSMSTIRDGCSAVTVGSRIVIAGGRNGRKFLATVEVFDTITGTWSMLPSLNHERFLCAAVLVGKEIFVIGGSSGCGEILDTVEKIQLIAPDVERPVPPALPPAPSPIMGRQEFEAELRKWTDEVKSAREGFEKDLEKASARLQLDLQEELGPIDAQITEIQEEIVRFQEAKNAQIRRLRLEKLAREGEATLKTKELRQGSQVWLDDIQEQLNHAYRHMQYLKLPPQLVCPITMEIMKEPVMTSDGHTYERAAIERVFQNTPPGQNPRAPVTGLLLENCTLTDNIAIRSMAREYQEEHGSG